MKEKNFYKHIYPEDFKIFEKECLNFIPEGETESLLKQALEGLDEIEPRRKKADRSFLKETVIDLCFIAFRERRQRCKDFTKRSRERNRVLLKEIPNQMKTIDKLLKFFEEYPELDDDISVTIREIEDKLYGKKYYPRRMPSRETNSI